MDIKLETPNQPEVVALIDLLDAYQLSLYPPESVYALDMNSLLQPNVLFAVARTAGWLAQWEEMLMDKDQKIARPRQIYTGPVERPFTPIGKR